MKSMQKLKDKFHDEGLIYLNATFNGEQVKELKKLADNMANLSASINLPLVYYTTSLKEDSTKIPFKVEFFCEKYNRFLEIVSETTLNSHIKLLLNDEPILFEDKLIFKFSGTTGFGAHQDYTWFGWEFFAKHYITALIAIDDCDEESGCIEFAHHQHKHGKIGETWRKDNLNKFVYKPMPIKAGDVILFDCFLPHQSKPNLKDKNRRAILFLTFNGAREGNFRESYAEIKPKVTRKLLLNRIKENIGNFS